MPILLNEILTGRALKYALITAGYRDLRVLPNLMRDIEDPDIKGWFMPQRHLRGQGLEILIYPHNDVEDACNSSFVASIDDNDRILQWKWIAYKTLDFFGWERETIQRPVDLNTTRLCCLVDLQGHFMSQLWESGEYEYIPVTQEECVRDFLDAGDQFSLES